MPYLQSVHKVALCAVHTQEVVYNGSGANVHRASLRWTLQAVQVLHMHMAVALVVVCLPQFRDARRSHLVIQNQSLHRRCQSALIP